MKLREYVDMYETTFKRITILSSNGYPIGVVVDQHAMPTPIFPEHSFVHLMSNGVSGANVVSAEIDFSTMEATVKTNYTFAENAYQNPNEATPTNMVVKLDNKIYWGDLRKLLMNGTCADVFSVDGSMVARITRGFNDAMNYTRVMVNFEEFKKLDECEVVSIKNGEVPYGRASSFPQLVVTLDYEISHGVTE